MSETQPISWRSIVYGTPVISSDDERVGKVDEVLGSDAEDIFHGLRVALGGGHREVMVSGDDVASMSVDQVRTHLTRSDIEALPTYDDVATYHLASVGWLRKHLGWKKDAKSDEETRLTGRDRARTRTLHSRPFSSSEARSVSMVGARGVRTSISFSWPDHGPALAGAVRLRAV